MLEDEQVTSHSCAIRPNWGVALMILLVLAHGLWNLEVSPPPFWDEGWTLMLARNWVERGFYGGLSAGQPTVVGLAASFPVVSPVALAFRLLGVGIWQGRVVFVFYTLGSLLLLHQLARRIWNRRVATGTLVIVLLLIPMLPELHPLLIGRMAMAEMPMMFYLLAGYWCLLLTLDRSAWYLPLTVLCWAIGLSAKGQPLPFWLFSLALPLALAVIKSQWRMASSLIVATAGSLVASRLLPRLWTALLAGQALQGKPLPGLLGAAALVLDPQVRLSALRLALVAGALVIPGLCHALWKMWRGFSAEVKSLQLVRWALLGFSASWLLWYVLLSAGWYRYLFPALFVGSVFAAAMLDEWTGGFDWRSTLARARQGLRRQSSRAQGLRALLAVALMAWAGPGPAVSIALNGIPKTDASVQQTAQFIHQQTPESALIESYSSELLFLLDRPYHYPPDEVNVPLIKALTERRRVPIDYDPLSADPDYLVVRWDYITSIVYEDIVQTGAFRSLQTFGAYEVFQRVR